MKKKSKKTIEREKHLIWRTGVLDRDKHKCQVCNRVKGVLHVHHIIPKQFKELRYDIKNGITLCFQHHKVGKLSAHQNALWFSDWLEANRLETYVHLIIEQEKVLKK